MLCLLLLKRLRKHRVWIARLGGALLIASMLPVVHANAASATLDQVRAAGKLKLGYRVDAQPLSYRDATGGASGFSVALCDKIADQVKSELALPDLKVDWVPVTLADRFSDLQNGKVDLLCGADTATLARMNDVAFSLPIFPSGIAALLRADAPATLRQVLSERPSASHPIWRGSPARTFLEKKTFSVVAGTSSEAWLAGRLKEFQIEATVVPVPSYEAGSQRVLARTTDVLFGDYPLLLDVEKRTASEDLAVLSRLFTHEPLALAFRKGDDDFRLIVDRTLSRLYRSPEFGKLFTMWFGKPNETAAIFYHLTALPD